jgi:hypothetical protein
MISISYVIRKIFLFIFGGCLHILITDMADNTYLSLRFPAGILHAARGYSGKQYLLCNAQTLATQVSESPFYSNNITTATKKKGKRKPNPMKKISASNTTERVESSIALSEYVKLVALNVTTFANQISCQNSTRCDLKTFRDMKITSTSLIDNTHKILMEFSPKAACTSAIVMFTGHMGFRYGIEYTGWPHTFRDNYLIERCGRATPCMYESKEWFRFKIVRNPFDRAVSSYIHIMRYPVLRDKVVPRKDRTTLSFSKFLSLLEKISPKDMQGYAGAHGGYQSQPYERLFYGRADVVIFHEIIQTENPLPAIERINKRLGTNFTIGFKGHHHADRKEGLEKFVGNMSWSDLKDQIPKNYGLFYNSELKLKVHQIFLWDILLYNYTFPYDLKE